MERMVPISKYIYRGDEFAIRSPLWWRDLLLGLTFGIALFFFLSDTLHWEAFKKHIPSELIFICIPFGLALLSPRRLLTVFLGFSILLFRFVFLIFLFQSLWSALVTVVWAIALILLGREANRRYRMLEFEIPDGTTGLEVLILMVTIGAACGMLFLLRRALGL
jgi:hypothetical protein